MRDPNPRVFAFWRNDLPPYVLGSPGELLPDGDFKAETYGGMRMGRKNIIAFYPVPLGTQKLHQIQAASQVHAAQLDEMARQHRLEIAEILPEMRKAK